MPEQFRFSIKLPKTITHQQRLRHCEALLDTFLAQVSGLAKRLGCLLVQLPPSVAFDADRAAAFLRALRERHSGPVAPEPCMYYSAYASAVLDALVVRLRLAADSDANVWCIFDNTAEGAAVSDALRMTQGLTRR